MNLTTDEILDMFENISKAKGTNAKKELLKVYLYSNLYFQTLISYSFNPYRSFHVVKVPKTKKEDRNPIDPKDAWKEFILNADRCSKREVTGNAAIELMQETFKQSSELQEKWMRKILKKNLAIGVSTKTINKVQANLIPTFEVSLAQKFERKRMSDWVYIEPKLDGVRCLAIVEKGEAKLFTRQGKLVTNFDDTVGKELLLMGDGCYDGEIMSKDFTELMRQVYRKDNKNIDDVYFAIFDFLTLDEWKQKKCQNILKDRKKLLNRQLGTVYAKEKLKYLKLVRFEPELMPSDKVLKESHDRWVSQGYEGIMIKDTDALYQFKRDWSVMKYKVFFDADCKIIALQEGTGKHSGKLGSFLVDYKGTQVNVGSGLTDTIREQIWKDPDSHIGRTIEVRYQEETPDGSLRFPTFVCFRNDK